MALIQCPECGTRISDKAVTCPHCGFSESDEHGLVPISMLPPAPQRIAISIPDAAVFDDGTGLVAFGMREKLARLMEDEKRVAQFAPAIYDAIQKFMAERGTIWAADFSSAAQKLMEQGELVLGVENKTGALLPQLRSVKTGQIYEKARLHAVDLPGDLAPSLATLQTQVMLAEVMGEIKDVAANVEALRLETRGDRIGRAKAVWLELQQAAKIQDPRLREQKLLGIASRATEQRCILQENFKIQLQLASSSKGKNSTKGQAAKEAITDLTIVALMARSECAAYELVGEPDASKEALKQFLSFVKENKLDERSTLLALNSKSSENLEETSRGFYHIAVNITKLALKESKADRPQELPEGEGEDER